MIAPGIKTWRRRKLAKRYPDGKITQHFRYQEFYTHDGTPIPASDKNLAGIERHCKVMLEPMRKKFGACHVVSGYRHRDYNASIGGARNSFHIWDMDDQHRAAPATDLIFATGNPEEWGAYARNLMKLSNGGNGGIGIYKHQGFVHVDLRPWVADWRGSGE